MNDLIPSIPEQRETTEALNARLRARLILPPDYGIYTLNQEQREVFGDCPRCKTEKGIGCACMSESGVKLRLSFAPMRVRLGRV